MGEGRVNDGVGSADPRRHASSGAREGDDRERRRASHRVGRGGERDVRTTTRRAAGPSGTSSASREREARARRATGRSLRLRRLGARRSDGHMSRASERGNHHRDVRDERTLRALAAVRISSAGITAPVTIAGGMVLSSSSFERGSRVARVVARRSCELVPRPTRSLTWPRDRHLARARAPIPTRRTRIEIAATAEGRRE